MKNNKILLTILVLLLTIFSVKAENCDVNDQVTLANEAAKVKIKRSVESKPNLNASCDLGTGEVCGATIEYYTVNILNMTENLYIEVSDGEDFSETINYSDVVDGIASFTWENLSEVTNLTFKVYSTENSSCSDKYLMTLYYTLPRKNLYANLGVCDGVEDYELCDEYVEFDEMDFEDFTTEVNKYKTKTETTTKTESFWSKIYNFLLKYVIWIILGICAIVGAVYIVINRKRSVK